MAEKKEAPPVVEESADAPKPKKKKTLLIVILAVILLGGAGAGWWFTMGKKPADPKAAEAHKKEEDSKPPVYARLDIFTVNLQKSDAEEPYLQTEFQLKVADEKVSEQVKLRSPEIRNALLLLLSSKTKTELVTIEGKQKLSEEIVANINKIIGAKDAKQGVQGVYFTTFVIQ